MQFILKLGFHDKIALHKFSNTDAQALSMANFAATLQEFQLGACDFEVLESQIEHDLMQDMVSANDLVKKLDDQHAIRPFDVDDKRRIERSIWTIDTRRRTELEYQTAGSLPTGSLTTGSLGPDSDATVVKSQTVVEEGAVLNNRYRLERLIGRGGMSEVYLAVDQMDEEFSSRHAQLAVKIVNINIRTNRDAVMAMQREVEKSKRLTHPNILRVHHFDRDGDIPFMTMEYLEGESLSQCLSRGFATLPTELLIRQCAEALRHAHENQIVHADFKPSNVFIDEKFNAKVIDFGIARALTNPAEPEADQTVFDPRRLGALTPAYASPEMLDGEEPDARDDIYALGCVAYELYTGKHPFARARANDARDNGEVPKQPKQIPRQQWAAIRHALEFDQTKRTPSAKAFLDEFFKPVEKTLPIVPIGAGVAALIAVVAGVLWFSGTDTTEPIAPVSVTMRDCPNCPLMLPIASGSEMIGSSPGAGVPAAEMPRHRIFISQPFAMSVAEVTVAEYREFANLTNRFTGSCRRVEGGWEKETALSWENTGYVQTDDHPAACVSYFDALAYTEWLSERTGNAYRLPSEAEWEYTARQHGFDVPAGCEGMNVADAALAEVYPGVQTASCSDGAVHTAGLGADIANATSPVNMLGNVFEWTSDCWQADYSGVPSDGSANTSGDCGLRVLRGGSWFTAPSEQRVAYRNYAPMDYRSNTFGFRVLRTINDQTTTE